MERRIRCSGEAKQAAELAENAVFGAASIELQNAAEKRATERATADDARELKNETRYLEGKAERKHERDGQAEQHKKERDEDLAREQRQFERQIEQQKNSHDHDSKERALDRLAAKEQYLALAQALTAARPPV